MTFVYVMLGVCILLFALCAWANLERLDGLATGSGIAACIFLFITLVLGKQTMDKQHELELERIKIESTRTAP